MRFRYTVHVDPKTMDDKFAEAFRIARQAANLSQAEVAQQMRDYGYEMSQPVVGKIERGERRVTIGEGEALSSIVGVSTRVLLEGPARLRLDRGVEYLQQKARDLRDAIEHFQSAQQVLAMVLDNVEKDGKDHPSTRFAAAQARELLDLTPSYIFDSYFKDVRTKLEARRIRDELDGPAEDDGTPHDMMLPRESHLAQLLQSRGSTIDSTLDALGFAEASAFMRANEAETDGAAADTAE